jgi:hypothetical protein
MKMLLSMFVLLLVGCGAGIPKEYEPREGDFVFQSLKTNRVVEMIEGVTGSPFSHCGIVVKNGNGWSVVEAIGPVKETELGEWIERGRGENVAVYRLKSKHSAAIPKMIEKARTFTGRPYDIRYRMDDEKIYCSELIYKGYVAATGRPLGKLEKLGDLNWRPYQATIREIEGGPVPMERELITPRAVTEAPEVEKVFSRGY